MNINLKGAPKKFGQAALTTSELTLYTVPAATLACILDINLCNTSANTRRASIYAGAAVTASEIVHEEDITSHTSTHWVGFQVLNAGDKITVQGDAVGLTATISGMEGI